jgi:hypothetical protein
MDLIVEHPGWSNLYPQVAISAGFAAQEVSGTLTLKCCFVPSKNTDSYELLLEDNRTHPYPVVYS